MVLRNDSLMTSKIVLSVEEAALQLGIGRSLAYEIVRQGRIRSVRAGNRILIPVAAIDEFLSKERA